MGWLTGWAYRKVLLIDPSEDGEQSDYQLNLAICKAATTSVSTSPYATSGGSEGQSPYTGHAWVDPANSYSDTLTFSSITSGFDTGDLSEVLINKGYANLANADTVSAKTIPAHATIKGIKVTIYRKYAVSIVRDALVQLSKDGGTTGTGDNKASTDDWPLASTAKVYGSSADLWGTTWTPTEINSANFGIRVAAQAMGDGAQAYISFIAISVYYNLVDCADLVAADFDDLRFTANDGTTLLPYFIERVYSGSAFVWVKMPTIAASPAQTTIYMYYSGTETAVSSVADTFGTGLADDFEHGSDEQDVSASGGNITWSQGNSGGPHEGKIDTAAYYGGTRGLRLYGSEFVYFTKAGAAGYAIRFMLRKDDYTLFTFGHGNATKALVLYVDAYREIMYVTTSNQHLSPAQYIYLSVFYSIELNNINFDAGTFDICRDVSPWWPEGKIKTGATMKDTSDYQDLIKMTVKVTLNNWVDNILIRKFTPNEPAWASFGDPVYVVPIVTTQAGTELGKDSFTANGNITNADGGYTRRGFCYIEGATGDPTTDDAVVFEDIESFDTGAYSELVSGLSIDTAYRVRAYVTNDMGTSYGDSVTVITTIDATYVEILTSDRALALDNTTAFTPDADYEPATKKYVDDFKSSLPNRNAIINGSFAVAQRGAGPFTDATTPLNSDDTYIIDRWTLLSDGNNIVDVSQETSPTITNPLYNIKLDVETANKKFGIVTILENKDSRRLANQYVSLSFKAKGTKVGAALTVNAIRAAVISWSSTADAVTSDVVSAWENAGTNPTLAANLTYENTPAALAALTESWQTYSITGIAVDTAGATNILVFIWVDDVTLDVGDFFQLAEVQLEIGSAATPFEYLPFQTELARCQRYCYGITTVAIAEFIGLGVAFSTTVAYPHLFLPVEMRATPSLIIATAGDWQLDDTVNAPTDVTALVIDDMTFSSKKAVVLKASAASGLTQYRSYYLVGDGNAGLVLALEAEL